MIVAGEVIEGAILDGNMGDGDVTSVALKLIVSGIPVFVDSGVGILAAIYLNLPVFLKRSAATRSVI